MSLEETTVKPNAAQPVNRPARKRIGEILQEAGLITDEDLAVALVESRKNNHLIGFTLVRTGKITPEQLGQALSLQYGVKYANINKLNIDKMLLDLLPEEFIRDKQAIPIAKERGRLVIAMTNEVIREQFDEVERTLNRQGSLTKALQETGAIPVDVMEMIATGEETGSLEKMLTLSLQYLGRELDDKIELLMNIAKPVTLVIMPSSTSAVRFRASRVCTIRNPCC